mgnify:CR=1 FL=1
MKIYVLIVCCLYILIYCIGLFEQIEEEDNAAIVGSIVGVIVGTIAIIFQSINI